MLYQNENDTANSCDIQVDWSEERFIGNKTECENEKEEEDVFCRPCFAIGRRFTGNCNGRKNKEDSGTESRSVDATIAGTAISELLCWVFHAAVGPRVRNVVADRYFIDIRRYAILKGKGDGDREDKEQD